MAITLCSTSAPTMKLLSAEVSGSTPKGSERYAQAHLLFGFEHESQLMPAPEQRVVNCPCGAKVLLRWTWSIGSTMYPVRCPDCGAEHRHHATPPVRSIGSTARATGNTSQRSTERRPNCESSGQCSEINCFPNPDGDALRPTGSLSNRKPLRKTASPLRTHLR